MDCTSLTTVSICVAEVRMPIRPRFFTEASSLKSTVAVSYPRKETDRV